ncbi:MAG: hydroxymethylbilane synthase [Candidatus Rokubacteria bacterium]|nr:hydroxymethylbilane synthase [Candidatus Rokubacteria bacterium]
MRLGTRGSALALAQSGAVRESLRALGAEVELVTIRTEGDRRIDQRLADVGGKGLFVKELEEALLDKRVDLAVHSLKDLPAEVPAGLTLAAFPAREDPRDMLVTRAAGGLDALRADARIGTSSPRRRALLLAARPDLRVEPLRGNVDTRLRKLAEGDWDGIVLAAAGLHRLGLAPAHATPLDPRTFVPAVGQGIVAIEARADDAETLRWLGALDDADARATADAERAYLARLGASCVTPMAAHARVRADRIELAAVVASEDGRQVLRETASGDRGDAAGLGRAVAERLLARGAASITALRPAGRA